MADESNIPSFDESRPFEEVDAIPSFDESRLSEEVDTQPSIGGAAVVQPQAPQPEEGDGALRTAQDFGLGAAQGLTLGAADELTGAAKAAYDVATTDKSLSDLKDLYQEYQRIEQARYKQAQERSPWAYGGGQLAGAIVPGVGAAGVAVRAIRPVTTLGRVLAGSASGAITGGVEGLASSEAPIIGGTEGDVSRALSEAKSGAALGGVLGGALETTLGKVAAGTAAAKEGGEKILEKFSYPRQLKKIYEAGKEGSDIISDVAKQEALYGERKAGQKIGEQLVKPSTELAGEISDVVEQATNRGIKLDVSNEVSDSLNAIYRLFKKDETFLYDPRAKSIFNYLENFANKEVTPTTAKSLASDLNNYAKLLSKESNSGAFPSLLKEASSKIRMLLKEQIPGYKEASEAFTKYSSEVPEFLTGKAISEANPAKFVETVSDEVEKFIGAVGRYGTDKATEVKNFKQFADRLRAFKQAEPNLYAKTGLPEPEAILNSIRSEADMSQMIRTLHNTQSEGFGGGIRSMLAKGAYGAGYAERAIGESLAKPGIVKTPAKAALDLGKRIYQATDDELVNFAEKLIQDPKLATKGQALMDAVSTKNMGRRNAILFTILQTPGARELLNQDEGNVQ